MKDTLQLSSKACLGRSEIVSSWLLFCKSFFALLWINVLDAFVSNSETVREGGLVVKFAGMSLVERINLLFCSNIFVVYPPVL